MIASNPTAGAPGADAERIAADIETYLRQHERKEILRFLTCGSVDDGKSTLIGRLLHDSELIYEDQLDAIRRDSKTTGTQRGGMDLALLVDGLQAEREQGITIDVAYRYFSTLRRKFIIADAPGHEQYTRNMVTGASTCDVAVILIDAKNGVLAQTRRHTFIACLLGIRHLIAAVNKMDEMDYAEAVFDDIRNDYFDFSSRLAVDELHFIPISALHGDNVVRQSANMPWYRGATLDAYVWRPSTSPPASDSGPFPVSRADRQPAGFRVPRLQRLHRRRRRPSRRPGDGAAIRKVVHRSNASSPWTATSGKRSLPWRSPSPWQTSWTSAGGTCSPRQGSCRTSPTTWTPTWCGCRKTPLVPGKPYLVKQGTREVVGSSPFGSLPGRHRHPGLR